MKKAVVIGASSGIGWALAFALSKEGYAVGLTGRRVELLEELWKALPGPGYVQQMDLARPDDARAAFHYLVEELGGVDLVVINSGIGYLKDGLDWETEKTTLAVNVTGFAAIATAALAIFQKQEEGGHLVGISSITALRGSPQAPAYSASKAFVSNYLEGIRCRLRQQGKDNIVITTIEPGFVDTDLVRGDPQFWTTTPTVAAKQICAAIRQRRSHAYVSRRWRLVAWFMKLVPGWLYWRGAPSNHH